MSDFNVEDVYDGLWQAVQNVLHGNVGVQPEVIIAAAHDFTCQRINESRFVFGMSARLTMLSSSAIIPDTEVKVHVEVPWVRGEWKIAEARIHSEQEK